MIDISRFTIEKDFVVEAAPGFMEKIAEHEAFIQNP